MSAHRPLDVTVIGAGLIGLTTALMLARDGHRVTVLDRDSAQPPPAAEDAWLHWDRPGVSHFRQPHLMLPRWYQEMCRGLPDLVPEMITRGALVTNTLHLNPASATHGWQPGDERFDTVTARRPVLESALALSAQDQPRLTLRRGVRVSGLTGAPAAMPHVTGVRTSQGTSAADLVVDASGRRTPVPGWLRELGGPGPEEGRHASGFRYFSRHYRANDGRIPEGRGFVLTHLPSLSVLTLPGDLGSYCVVLITSARDPALRALRDPAVWLAVVGSVPTVSHWVREATPLTDVMALAGIEDVTRSYLRDDQPVATGVLAVGDSAAATNPSLGRGASFGAMQAAAIREVLTEAPSDPAALVRAVSDLMAERVDPWVQATLAFDRNRLAEMDADIAGHPYDSGEPSWPMVTALATGAAGDPVLARAHSRIAGVLDLPAQVFADPAVRQRVGPYVGLPRYPDGAPSRAALLETVRAAQEAEARTDRGDIGRREGFSVRGTIAASRPCRGS